MVIVYYFHDSAPEATATCNLDEHLLAWRMKRRKTKLSKKWDEALGKGVLIFSDQQLITLHYITGTGILGSGFSQLSCGISSYHWQIIVYLAWFSSLTHLTTMTFMRQYFRNNPLLRFLRILFMLVLVLLLIAAPIPTANNSWLDEPALGLPAICTYELLNPTGSGAQFSLDPLQTTSAILSIYILFVSYTARIIRFFTPSAVFVRRWLRKNRVHGWNESLMKWTPPRKREPWGWDSSERYG